MWKTAVGSASVAEAPGRNELAKCKGGAVWWWQRSFTTPSHALRLWLGSVQDDTWGGWAPARLSEGVSSFWR
jgi:hypothetical protein